MENQLKGKHIVDIENSEQEAIDYSLIMVPEKAKRPTVAVHGAEVDADAFVAAADQAKQADAVQKGKKETLTLLTKQIRDLAVSGDVDVPETIRFATKNGRSVTSTAKYNGVKIDTDMYTNLRNAIPKNLEEIVTENVSLVIDLRGKNPKLLARKCAKALKGIADCEETISYKTNSGIDVYRLVEELLNSAGDDIEMVEALTELRKVIQPTFSVAVSTKTAVPKR